MNPQDPSDLRPLLRRLPALAGPFPPFDPSALPDRPDVLFGQWLREAIDAGVLEPHAMTVSTASATGRPSARVVILKDLVDGGWQFATDARSGKADDLDVNPIASVSFYWREQGRQVRLVGTARAMDPEVSAADFLARSPASRAAALATRPGEPLRSTADLRDAMARARRRVEEGPDTVLPEWVLYSVVPDEVEFWQGDPGRAHTRVVYRRGGAPRTGGAGSAPGRLPSGAPDGTDWDHELVWP